MRSNIKKITQNAFVRSVGMLAGGTVFGQLLGILALPVLSRLYSPNAFSVLAVYAALLAMISVVACLRFEIAIPLPKNDEDAAALLILALLSSVAFGGGTASVLYLWTKFGNLPSKFEVLTPYIWLLAVSVWLTSSYSAMQYWATRAKNFRAIAKTRVSQSLLGLVTQLGMGSVGLSPLGLLLGQSFNSAAGVLSLGAIAWRRDSKLILHSINRKKAIFLEYQRYPRYSTFEALLNSAGIQLPVVLIAAMSVGSEAGYLFLATRVMSTPMGLIGGAVGQVFLSRAAAEHRNEKLNVLTTDVTRGLIKIGVGPLVFAGIVAPTVFPLIFGIGWQRAGELVCWMTPWLVLQFISSPISMVMHVRGWQKTMLLLAGAGFLLRSGSVLAAHYLRPGFESELFALSGALYYLVCYGIFLKAAGIKWGSACKDFISSSPFVIAWMAFGIIFLLVKKLFFS